MDFNLDQATRLTPAGDGRFTLALDRRYWTVRSAFGGWVGAVCAEAVQQHADYRFEIVTQQINFHAAVRDANLMARVRLIERRRTMDFWQVDLGPAEQPERVDASATIVCGEREATKVGYEHEMPQHKDAADCIQLPSGDAAPVWFKQYEIRLAKGRPFAVNSSPRSAMYVRESDGRALDSKALLAIVDTSLPRSLFRSEKLRLSATISLSTFVFATDEELAAVGPQFVLLDTDCKTIRHGFFNQETCVYRSDGLLLATSYQAGRFRE